MTGLTGLCWLASLSLLAACGSAGRVAQPEDDFLDKVEAQCLTASKGIDKLDFSAPDAGEVDKYVDFLAVAVEAFKELEPPQSLTKDFDNLVDSIDDQIAEGATLSDAIDVGDTAAVDTSAAALSELSADADRSAESLGALRCKALAPGAGVGTTVDTISVETTVDTTADTASDTTTGTTTAETIVETTVETTVATTIEPPPTFDTTTVDTTETTTGDEIYPDDLNLFANPPPGYLWVDDYEQSDAAGLYDKSILGPLITSYSAGRVENIADGHTASIFVITLSSEWTPDAIDQYLFWEGVDEGFDTVTPAGLPVRQALEAFEETDCLAYYTTGIGISVCTFSGIDGLAILDAYIAAQPA